MIDIKGIPRDELLKELWEDSITASFYYWNDIAPPVFDIMKAREQVLGDGYCDYICGRVIKAQIYGENDMVNPYLYDRDNGEGAFQNVVNKLRARGYR